MSYVMGCVYPVASQDRERFTAQARETASFFSEFGASDVADALGDDIPDGKITDFRRAVAATDGDLVGFGWVQWQDENARAEAERAMMDDPRMRMDDMAFDGKRMIYGGFEKVVDEGPGGSFGYVDGFVLAVPTASRDVFIEHCRLAAPIFLKHGATRHVECWGTDVPDGKVTDFKRAVQARPDETVCFSWIEWPDRPARDRGQAQVFAEMERTMDDNPMPFDGKRMIYGGFEAVYRTRT